MCSAAIHQSSPSGGRTPEFLHLPYFCTIQLFLTMWAQVLLSCITAWRGEEQTAEQEAGTRTRAKWLAWPAVPLWAGAATHKGREAKSGAQLPGLRREAGEVGWRDILVAQGENPAAGSNDAGKRKTSEEDTRLPISQHTVKDMDKNKIIGLDLMSCFSTWLLSGCLWKLMLDKWHSTFCNWEKLWLGMKYTNLILLSSYLWEKVGWGCA